MTKEILILNYSKNFKEIKYNGNLILQTANKNGNDSRKKEYRIFKNNLTMKNINNWSSSGLDLEMYNNLSIGHNVYRVSRSKLKNNFSVDFTSENKVKKFFKNLKKKLKKIHNIIYCVGMSKSKQENIQEWKKIFDINFFSFVNTLNSYCDVYKKQSTKFIVVSSIAGSANISGAPITYSIAKNALTKYSIYKSKLLNTNYCNVLKNILQENNLWK